MSNAAEELLDEAMKLPESERRLIALVLLDSVGEEPPEVIERAWIDEALRRLENLRSGLDAEATDDPVPRAVLTAPAHPGQPPEWEAEVLERAATGPWFDGSIVSAEIAARARHGRAELDHDTQAIFIVRRSE